MTDPSRGTHQNTLKFKTSINPVTASHHQHENNKCYIYYYIIVSNNKPVEVTINGFLPDKGFTRGNLSRGGEEKVGGKANGTWQCSTSSGNTWMTDFGPPYTPKRSNSSMASRAACIPPENRKNTAYCCFFLLANLTKKCVLPLPVLQSYRWALGCPDWSCRLSPTSHNPKGENSSDKLF